jgi:hypothetical protein
MRVAPIVERVITGLGLAASVIQIIEFVFSTSLTERTPSPARL